MLDIIIPVYNNQKGLERTLASINPDILNQVTITIIDDCSDIPCKSEYTTIRMDKNSGPGAARQKGINMTNEEWIIFIDAGDIFSNFEIQKDLLATIQKNSSAYLIWYIFNFKDKTNNILLQNSYNNMLHGKIYNRKFLQKYYIEFCETNPGSYMNEDVGFNLLCRIIIMDKKISDKLITINTPLITQIYEEFSLTKKNNGEFEYKIQMAGLTNNIEHIIKLAEKNNCSKEIIIGPIYLCFGRLYYDLQFIIQYHLSYATRAWDACKNYYNKCYLPYRDIYSPNIKDWANKHIIQLLNESYTWPRPININFKKFLLDLERKDYLPDEYLI